MLTRRLFRNWFRGKNKRLGVRLGRRLQMNTLEHRLVPANFLVSAQVGATPEARFLAAIAGAKAAAGADDVQVDEPTITLSGQVTLDDTANLKIYSTGGATITGTSTTRIFNFTSASSVTLTLEKLTLSGGTTTANGGAILMAGQKLVTDSVTFQSNKAVSGGAISASSASASVTLNNSSFVSNTGTTSGGAVHFGASTSTLNMTGTSFSQNSAGSTGGGAIVASALLGTWNSSTFDSNVSGGSGGVFSSTVAVTLTINSPVVTNNSGTLGGAFALSASSTTLVSITVTDGTFSGNKASSTGGGAFYVIGGTLSLTSTDLFQNSATGGGGGAIYQSTGANLSLDRVSLWGNSASGVGGAIRYFSGNMTVLNTTMSGNTAAGTAGGGAIYNSQGNSTISFSTITGNRATGATTTGGGGGIRKVSATTGNVVINNSVIYGNLSNLGLADIHHSTAATTISLTGVNSFIGSSSPNVNTAGITGAQIGVDPLLSPTLTVADGTYYHLPLPGSPLRNGGSNSVTSGNDQRGASFTRPLETGYDVGAIESASDPAPFGSFSGLADVVTAGATPTSFQVVFTDFQGDMITGSLATAPTGGASDVELLDPYGVRVPITAAVLEPGANGSSATVTYTFTVPGSAWDIYDNGTYSVKILPNEVSDSLGNFNTASQLGIFRVGVNGTVTVTTASDVVNSADGVLSLREALTLTQPFANGSDTIAFAAGINGSTITLGSVLTVNDALFVQGNGAANTIISGNDATQVFFFSSGISGASTIDGVTITKGKLTGSGSAVASKNNAVTISNSVLTANSSSATGGAVFVEAGGVLTITSSTLSNNISNTTGGAIGITGAGTVSISLSTVSGNTATTNGGGAYLTTGTITVNQSTFSGNVALGTSGGGGLSFSTGTASIENSTFSGNLALGTSGFGGAIRGSSSGTLTITNATLYANSANKGGGLGFSGTTSTTLTNVTINNSIVAGNSDTAQLDMFTAATTVTLTVAGDNNLIGVVPASNIDISAGTNNKFDPDPKLAPLGNYGGPTQTHALIAGSLAINNGALFGSIDQRGFVRPSTAPGEGPNADIGAYEGTLKSPTAKATVANVTQIGAASVKVSVVYTDEGTINTSTLDLADIVINGKSYTNKAPASRVIIGSGSTVTVEYTFNAPNNVAFVPGDNGAYTVTMNAGQVFDQDTIPNSVLPGTLATFFVAVPNVYTVDALGDLDDGNVTAGNVTLREAVRLANDNNVGFADKITFSSSLNGSPIVLGSELKLTDPVIIEGNGTSQTIISGNDVTRIFNFSISGFGSESNISSMTLKHGKPTTGNGGAILQADDDLAVSNVRFEDNQTVAASSTGGAISVAGGTLTISDSVFTGSTAVGSGGAIHNSNSSSVLSLTRTTVSGSSAGAIGGGIYFSTGSLTIRDTTISGNTAASTSGGGGISVSTATVVIANSTISGNSAANGAAVGGGIRVSGAANLRIANSTITRNTASGAGGGGISFGSASAVVQIDSSIIAQNFNAAHPDLYSSVTASLNINGFTNFVGAMTDFDILFGGFGATGDAKLAPLANNGGPTQTHALNVLSPALDAGSNTLVPPLTNDQRGAGFPRSIGNTDVGSFEGISTVPQGFVTLTDVPPNSAVYTFTVTYTDDVSISLATLGNANIQVSGPAFASPINAEFVNSSGPGQTVVVTYQFLAPNGAWTAFDNGTYTVTLLPNTVSDGTNYAYAGTLGTFKVSLSGAFLVDNAGDADDGNHGAGELTFREAMKYANLDTSTTDTITFAAGINGQTITLGTGLTIDGPVAVTGNGTTQTVISGGNAVRLFTAALPGVGGAFSFSDISLVNGSSTAGGGTFNLTDDSLSLTNVRITGSKGTLGGAIQMTSGTLTITGSQISGNSASTSTGGAITSTTGSIAIVGSTVSGNTATTSGGGVYFTTGSLSITDSTFSGNVANSTSAGGGGVGFTTGALAIVNSTFSGNSAPGTSTTTVGGAVGGAIRVTGAGVLTINNSTITRNTAGGKGGGIAFTGSTTATLTTVNVESSVIADNVNAGAPDLYTAGVTVTVNFAGDYNLIGDLAGQNFTVGGGNNQVGDKTVGGAINPQLAPLGNYGGPTQTHAPFLGSPVIDKGSNPQGLLTDQRGVARPGNPALFDIGSVEGALVDPVGRLDGSLLDVTTNGTTYTFSIVYEDEGSINLATINGDEMTVTGPTGNVISPVTVGTISGSGSSVTVSYSFTPAGGSWDFFENGVYSIKLNAGSVADQDSPTPHTVRDTSIGKFRVGLAGSVVVDSIVDEDDGNFSAGDVSLREAVRVAGSVIGGAGTVTFSPSLNGQTITLSLGQMDVAGSMVVTGPGASLLTVSGNNTSRIFNIDDGTAGSISVSLSGMTLTKGLAAGDGGAINDQNEHLLLTDMTLTNNSATFDGGALNVETDGAIVTILNSTISYNRTGTVSGNDPDGGGINFQGEAAVTIKSSSIVNNTSFDDGGGMLFFHTVTKNRTVLIEASTIANNVTTGGTGAYGGGINFGGFFDSIDIRNSTISGNTTSAQGGGIQFYNVDTTTTIINSTIAGNKANTNGGGINQFTDASGTINLESTIVSDNTSGTAAARDINSTVGVISSLNSAIGAKSVTNYTDLGGNLLGQNLMLLPLALNGGPTATHALAGGSLAINAGSNPLGFAFDQRGAGFSRSIGTTDIGAYEYNADIPYATVNSPNVTTGGGTTYTFTVTFTDDVAIDISTVLNGADVSVSGPGGFSTPATLVSVDVNSNGTPRVATYSITPPGGSWDGADNGSYTIILAPNAVTDTLGTPVPSGPIGSFNVAVPVVVVVDLLTDENDGNTTPGDVSLREAVLLANASAASLNLITFAPGLFAAGPATLNLSLGQMDISANVTIQGPGANLLTIDAKNLSRHFSIGNAGLTLDVGLAGMTLVNGQSAAANDGGSIVITSSEVVTLESMHLKNNTAARYGGAIHATSSTLIVNNSTFSSNRANSGDTTFGGGAILMQSINSNLTVRNSTLTNNLALAGVGGAINFYSSSNSNLIVENSTISHNTAINAGGIRVFSTATMLSNISSSIVSQNAFSGTGTQPDFQSGTGAFTITQSLIGSETGLNATSKVLDSFTSTNVGVNPLLGALQNNGGPTPTRALLTGSPAINFGSSTLTTDQRGRSRNSGGGVDIGAYEVNPAAKVTGLVINNGAAQRSRVTTLRVNFDSPIGLADLASSFSLSRVGDSATVSLNSVLDASGTFVTITFTGGAVEGKAGNYSLADGRYVLTAAAAQFNGDGLDGDGNGTGGDNYLSPTAPFIAPSTPPVGIFRLYGDADGNGKVESNDFLTFRLNFLSSNDAFDNDGNGQVDSSDFLRFRLNFLSQIN